MSGSGLEGQGAKYTTSPRVQAWFLKRSRDNWREKYGHLKADAKRLQNRVNDVARSREQWRETAGELRQQVQELRREKAALEEQLAALKKDGRRSFAGACGL